VSSEQPEQDAAQKNEGPSGPGAGESGAAYKGDNPPPQAAAGKQAATTQNAGERQASTPETKQPGQTGDPEELSIEELDRAVGGLNIFRNQPLG
jgi:hypothetical protein